MTHLVITLLPDGTRMTREFPKNPGLDVIKTIIGGWPQQCPYFTKLTDGGTTYFRGQAWADEDGLMKSLPLNRAAKAAWQASCPTGDPSRMNLVGTIAFVVKKPKS